MGQLFEQVSHKDNEDTKSHCHEDAGLECVDKEGRTPLISACTKSELFDGEKTLLQLGSDVNAFLSAYPMIRNDDSQTPLKVARAKGYSNIVRTIESHICLFSGWMREFYGPSYVELFAPQLLSRRVWVVIVPTGSQNPTKPFKLELVVYASLQDAQPRTVIPLWKAKLEEPKSDQSDASVMIGPTRKRQRRRGYISHARRWAQVDWQMRLKLAPAKRGDIQQLNWFCEACKGIPQPLNPPICENNVSNEVAPSVYPLRAVAAVEDGSIHYPSVDVDLSLPCEKCEDKEDGGGSRVCVICVDSSSEAVCVPCGHVAGCVSCLKEIKDKKLGCPVCCADIDQVIKLYHV
ncbi:hypothetical protein EUTSA_v10025615mg [Eutrema salsugineum]|uniref:RING-type domain-containing protein n=1 Tax=Eutrema salsugineum TaxID=72664 RepID=V4MHV7_EUTSA|nr:putative E3 ubiquitin-protein ligase XBAT35 isoform X2 [Eutrema salsugineum]ESQ56179.1 hypothetical protein EUTSA_v10025615mg [Eutrema salsugineum]